MGVDTGKELHVVISRRPETKGKEITREVVWIGTAQSYEELDDLLKRFQVSRCVRLSWSRALPKAITVDHGTEFTSRALDEWAFKRGVELDFIRPGKPIENALIESFNGRLRDESLNVHEFTSLEDAALRLEIWRQDYNRNRPHGALGNLTPSEFAERGQEQASEGAEFQLRSVQFRG
jgi:transposase InsO family protein